MNETNTTVTQLQTNPTVLLTAISKASPEQIDTIWSVLKYREIGIMRKVKCITSLLKVDFDSTISQLPKDESGRLLDHKTRHLIHDTLIKHSNSR